MGHFDGAVINKGACISEDFRWGIITIGDSIEWFGPTLLFL